MIVERTQEGKAIAKQREDFREGRPNNVQNMYLDPFFKQFLFWF